MGGGNGCYDSSRDLQADSYKEAALAGLHGTVERFHTTWFDNPGVQEGINFASSPVVVNSDTLSDTLR